MLGHGFWTVPDKLVAVWQVQIHFVTFHASHHAHAPVTAVVSRGQAQEPTGLSPTTARTQANDPPFHGHAEFEGPSGAE